MTRLILRCPIIRSMPSCKADIRLQRGVNYLPIMLHHQTLRAVARPDDNSSAEQTQKIAITLHSQSGLLRYWILGNDRQKDGHFLIDKWSLIMLQG
jgi:hypothetical protein